MNEFVFLHIPKTAGTSFRIGAEHYFGVDKVCCDYGPKSPKTSACVLSAIYEAKDFWSFVKMFREKGFRFLTGHVPANKFAPLFGIERMVTCFRDPLQRIVSEYKHFVRHYGYTDDFQTFYRTPQFINRQAKSVHGIPWMSLGFIGLTERYADSLDMLNQKYALEVPIKKSNMDKASIYDVYELNAGDEAELRRLNAQEIAMYRQVCALFEQRAALAESSKPFVRGMLGGVSRDTVTGWAVFDTTDDVVNIEVIKNGDLSGMAEAKDYMPQLNQIGVRRGGYCGYGLKISALKVGDTIECKVAATGQPLVGSPHRVTDADVNK